MIYQFKCNECGHKFEEVLKLKDFKKPERASCPKCEKKKCISRDYGQQNVSQVRGLAMKSQIDGGFREVLSKVKKAHPKGNIGNNKFDRGVN